MQELNRILSLRFHNQFLPPGLPLLIKHTFAIHFAALLYFDTTSPIIATTIRIGIAR